MTMQNDPQLPSDPGLESALKSAPAPRPPAELTTRLRKDIAIHRPSRLKTNGWRRWWPVGLSGGAAVAFAALVIVQNSEFARHPSTVPVSANPAARANPSSPSAPATDVNSGAEVADERADFERLKAKIGELKGIAAQVDAIEATNRRLEAEIAAAEKAVPPELQEAVSAQGRAQRIRCINNLKQLGLAVRVYAVDNGDEFPKDIKSMLDEIGSPSILQCPEDGARRPWTMDELKKASASDAASACSYEFLSPGPGKYENDPQRVLFRCPIHGSVGLCDGSVQAGNGPDQSVLQGGRVERRNGAYYFVSAPPESAPKTDSTGASATAPKP
jgi:hypothetical protein